MSQNDRIYYDEMASAFRGEKIERDGIIAEVEGVRTASDDPDDADARFTIEVRARPTEKTED